MRIMEVEDMARLLSHQGRDRSRLRLHGDFRTHIPVTAEVLSVHDGRRYSDRNDETFHNYRKYSADSAITFDDVQVPPDVPEAKTCGNRRLKQPPAKTDDTIGKEAINAQTNFSCVVVFCVAALAQTLTVENYAEFIHSSTHEMKGKLSDKDIAAFIAKMKLNERWMMPLSKNSNEGAGPLIRLRSARWEIARQPARREATPLSLTVVPKQLPPPLLRKSKRPCSILSALSKASITAKAFPILSATRP